jgi:hypothetical protein
MKLLNDYADENKFPFQDGDGKKYLEYLGQEYKTTDS